MRMKKNIFQAVAIPFLLALLLMPSLLPAQDSSYDRAVTAYMKKDFKTAANLLREYVKKNPDPHAYYLLGYALYEQKNHVESAKYFKEAYVLDPNISPIMMK